MRNGPRMAHLAPGALARFVGERSTKQAILLPMKGCQKPEIKPKAKTKKKAKSKRKSKKKSAPRRSGKLVVVESPAKARTIGRYLGRGYKVMSSVGHVRDLLRSPFKR